MTLQNRVSPDGEIIAAPHRGLFLGNRGGVIHNHETKTLHPTRRWASRQWICCVLSFKSRQRQVMSANTYTELFFMDEVTALSAGHRPCFECRRADAVSFAKAFSGSGQRASAPQMDRVLQEERLAGKQKRLHRMSWPELPNGTIASIKGEAVAKSDRGALLWSFTGYTVHPDFNPTSDVGSVDCLTPPSIVLSLSNGYKPHWHPSAQMS